MDDDRDAAAATRVNSFRTDTAAARPATADRPATANRLGVEVVVNGERHELEVESWVTLLDLLRDRLDLIGTKKGCDHGQCGACTVLVGGTRINSCLTLAVMHDGAEIVTVEGLADGENLHPVQQAFIDRDAFQCGYCTPGQLCSALGLRDELGGTNADAATVREFMSGNVCRCGAYPQITQAVLDVVGDSRVDEPHVEETGT